jgi:PadR family transcriptional regulator AphA
MTTTSHAVRALLELKPWTGYELTHQAQRSLRNTWSKSERLHYFDPKKLVELGFATSHQEGHGGCTRNAFTMTESISLQIGDEYEGRGQRRED